MAATNVTLSIPEGEVAEATEAAKWFTGREEGTGKELLAAVANEVMKKWRDSTKRHSAGGVT